jgi:REP element-mobilizing transposase RayT
MAHTCCSLLFHCVFSTKERRKIIPEELQERLWAYMGGIAREHGMKALAVGGMEDHVHILLSLPSTKTVANAMREIKAGSSGWMHETCNIQAFEWQEGYGAFSIG